MAPRPPICIRKARVGFDWRTSPGYSRRGGFYGVTLHDYADQDEQFGFRQVDYEAIQHFPILREAWVISLRGLARTDYSKTNQQVPFFMLPYVGGGSTLRGFTSHRFRDQNGLPLQAEWRIMANRFMDTAFFYDAGKVAARSADLDFNGLKSDYGFGVRFHGPFATPLRIEVAKSPEGLGSDLRHVRRSSETACHVHIIVRRHVPPRRPPDSAGRRARRVRPRRLDDSVLTSIRTIRSRASRSPRTRRRPQPYDIGSLYEMTYNLFVTAGYKPSGTRAQNINTIDEVPDSNWFTNRIGTTPVTVDEIARGPNRGAPPDPSRWMLIREKTAGAHPGFTARDAKGETWFLEFDPPTSRKGRPGRWRSRRRSSGRSATTRWNRS